MSDFDRVSMHLCGLIRQEKSQLHNQVNGYKKVIIGQISLLSITKAFYFTNKDPIQVFIHMKTQDHFAWATLIVSYGLIRDGVKGYFSANLSRFT